MIDKWLIVNGDDFGIHHDVNLGIIHAHTDGLIQSTSLMVNTPATQHGVEILKDHPFLEVGLHLNISTQKSVSPPNQISELVNDQGVFWVNGSDIARSFHMINDAIEQVPNYLGQIEIEFKHQVDLFYRLIGQPTHINIHHYLAYAHPKLFKLYLSLAKQVGCPCRGLCYPALNKMQIHASTIEMMKQAFDENTKCPSYSVSNLVLIDEYTPNDVYQEKMVTLLKKLYFDSEVNSVELVTHPSILSPFILENDNFSKVRILENHLVNSNNFKSQINSIGYKLSGYSVL